MKFLFILISCLWLHALIAQDTTIVIYFKSGQSKLTSDQQKRIDNLKNKHLSKISFEGYADTVGKKSFNKKLSYNRAAKVANTLNAKDKNIVGKGECTERKTPLNKMRKVVVKAWYEQEVKPIEQPIEVIKIEAKPIDCTIDTTIETAGGTLIKINKCEFEKIKTCFKFKEYLNAKAVQDAGLTTNDEKGNPIESGGMFDIQFCDNTCLNNPIFIFIPVPICLKQEQMTMWGYLPNGNWRNSNAKIEFVKINGVDYYKIAITCPGRYNCDRPKKQKVKKYKFKAKDGIKIKEATVSYSCPLTSYKGKIKRKGKKAVFLYYCPKDQPIVSIKAVDKNGDTLSIKGEQLNNYTKKRRLISKCSCEAKRTDKYAGIFKIRKKYLYRKYKFYKEDFKK